MSSAKALWVFGYGSLMWRPGFRFEEAYPALLRGWHRAFCLTSTHYRGTAKAPGLVLGLAPGGACVGRVFRVAPARARRTIDYLRARENIPPGVYIERFVAVRIGKRRVRALTYVANRDHPDYAGGLSRAAVLAHIRRGRGVAGSNLDYLANTVRHLDAMGIADGPLHRLRDAAFAGRRGRRLSTYAGRR